MVTRYIDFSGLRLKPGQAKANGAAGMFRYIAPPPSVAPAANWKRITKDEFDGHIQAGEEVVLNWEWYAGRCLEGAAAGREDGAWAYAAARALGYAKGAVIYVSHDTGTRDDLRVGQYFREFRAQQKGYYEVRAPYSGIGTVEALRRMGLAVYIWQTLAWSYGAVSKFANVYQNGKVWFGKQADEDVILKSPVGGHLETLAAKKPPAHKPPVKPPPVKPPKPPIHKPVLRRRWPGYMKAGNYFGLVTGPAHSHGGYYASERGDVKAIQQRLQALGYAPKAKGWADGIFGPPTVAAVASWQKHHMPHTQFFGQVWSDDWAKLFTY